MEKILTGSDVTMCEICGRACWGTRCERHTDIDMDKIHTEALGINYGMDLLLFQSGEIDCPSGHCKLCPPPKQCSCLLGYPV